MITPHSPSQREIRRRLWLEGTAELTRALLGGLGIHEAMNMLTQRMRRISAADFVAVVLVDQADPASVVYEAVEGLGIKHGMGTRLPRRGLTAATLRTGEPLLIADLPSDERFDPPDAWRNTLREIGPAVFMPLIAEGIPQGALIVGWRRASGQEHFDTEETTQLQIFADYAALALQRVRDQEQRRRRDRWLETTAGMARLLLGEVDRDDAMRMMVRQLRGAVGADVVGVILVDPIDPTSARAIIFEGLGRPVPPGRRLPMQGLVPQVIKSGERVVSFYYTREPGYQPPAEWAEALSDVGLGMLIPLLSDNNTFGVLFAAWRRGSPLEHSAANEVEQVQTFADLTALALHRVRSQNDRAQLLLLQDRDRIARDISDAVLQRLFATALRLRTAYDKCPEQQVQQSILAAIRELDEINEEIRSAIFRIRPDEAGE
ncbi:GAF domain-containing protein [Actinopolymorpha sp. NPDC004070]|uniref:GAF domain-containing protein n=1 Tax=Actinopolymorpha sp. NPDC004070 TaxID=3154548 RepID=UPI0033B46427